VVTDDQALDGNVRVQATSLLVLEEEGTALNVAGRVDDIGKGEFVQAVRFFGDRGYVVTYPEETFIDDGTGQVGRRPIVDPLFVLDIEDPRAPRLRGELKVPGYSTYLHPYGEDHLISVGVDTDTANNYQGLALSLFDVSDPDAPSLAVRLNFGDERSVSEAVANHHAFTFFAEKNLLALPHARTATVNGGLESSGLEVFHIDPATGIEHLGTVEQMPLLSKSSLSGFGPQDARCGGVRRSVMMADESETYVYAVSSVGITVASVDDVVHALDDVDYGSSEALCDDTGWTAF